MANYLALDVGRKRVGLSRGSDDLGVVLPMRVLSSMDRMSCLREVTKTVSELKISVVVVGYPLNMDDSRGEMAEYVDKFVAELKRLIGGDVAFVMFDERLTSVQAEADLQAMRGSKFESPKRKKKVRKSGIIDSNAAAIILRDYFNELSLHTL
ncbi:MAG: Holliday junction resolvase RuvX [Puniceicoccales bacterium]|jgi:putative Holliday junction resolvase|nr:Holliday junction resolvase RuvX [Puniceicoccales bacterium]